MSEENLTYFQRLQLIKIGKLPKEAVKKVPKPLRSISPKRAAEIAEEKEARGNEDTFKEAWFKARRREMVGICQCGCTQKSSKNDNLNFRSSAAHIFPQRLFPSIQYHKLNWVERAIWATPTSSSCHTNMDNQSMDLWVNFADWDDIKAKYHELIQCLTEEEKKQKFFNHLTYLVYGKQ